jgi:hypothetical protein
MSIAPGEKAAFTIDEFCAAHGISRTTFYHLRRSGAGPREMHIPPRPGARVGTKILISAEAAAAWRREREAASVV